jgi:hypothetical protein
MSLSICLLTRDEERNLPQALRSVAGLADEVVVADTGSTDRTVAVAKEHGATPILVPWADDFGAARNLALAQATGDWVFWLNPDEELLTDSRGLVQQCVARPDALAYSVIVRDLVDPARMDSYTETMQVRLFRHHPEIQYAGRAHPHFVQPIEDLARRENQAILSSPITIQRHGYLSVPTEAKLRWAARLMAFDLQDHPSHLTTLIHYGKTLLKLNDPEGHVVLARAVEQILPLRTAARAPLPDVALLLEYLLTVSPEQSRSRLSRDEAWELTMRWFPESPPLLWIRASQLFKAGAYHQAAGLLATLVNFGQTGRYDKSANFNPTIIGLDALMNLGACHAGLGRFDQAEYCFRQLLNSHTHRPKAQQYIAEVHKRRQKHSPRNPC